MKTREQILADITIIYKKYFPTFNTNRTVFADLYLNAPTEVLEQIYASLTYLLNIFNLTKVNDIQTVDLDNYAASYGLTRLPGTKANGRIRFYKTILPSSPILIPASTAVATLVTSESKTLRFYTLEDAYFTNLALFDVDRFRYYVEVPIESEDIGAAYNLDALTIQDMLSEISGLEVLNIDSTIGGTDGETNQSLANRIIVKFTGVNLGTVSGYESMISQNFNTVLDTSILLPDDDLISRPDFGGNVDIYIKTLVEQSAQNQGYYTTISPISTLVLTNLPFNRISNITVTISGTLMTLVADRDYFVIYDDASFKGSIYEKVTVRFDFDTVGVPDDGTYITVNYIYNPIVNSVQSFINQSSNKVIGSDVYVFEANRKSFAVYMDVTLDPTVDFSNTVTLIRDALKKYVNQLPIESTVEPLTLIDIVGEIEGVRNVNPSTFLPSTSVSANKIQELYLTDGDITIV